MSASAMTDSLVTMLRASSAFGAGGVSDDFSVLESSSGSCCVVAWTELQGRPITFGTEKEEIWTMTVRTFSRDTGNPAATIKRLSSCIEAVLDTVRSDDTLQGTCESMVSYKAKRDPQTSIETGGGATWLFADLEIDFRVFP